MENEKPFSETQSLELIHSMIRKAQGKLRDNGFYFLLWGWLVFVSAVGMYTIAMLGYPEYSGWTWTILMPLGGLISGVRGWREGKKQRVKTYADELLHYVLAAFLASLFIVLVFMSSHGSWKLAYPMIMMIYGSWLFVSGGMLKFRPLIIGGIINWGCAIAGFYIQTFEIVLLLAFAVLAGYIIPGHLLKMKYHREQHEAV